MLEPDHPVTMDEVRTGDLFFLEPDDDPVSKEVVVLDGAPFAHVGIMAGPDKFVSARVGSGRRRHDPGGGVACNTYKEFGDRNFWLARSAPSAAGRRDPAAAVSLAIEHVDQTGRGGDRTDFSYVKLVLVAFALRAFDAGWRAGLPLRPAVVAAARAWSEPKTDPSDTPAGENFYCAEFVAHAYGVEFTMADFPPPLNPHDGGKPGALEPFDVVLADGPRWAVQVVSAMVLLGEMWEADRTFLGHCGKDVLELLKKKIPDPAAAAIRDWHKLKDAVDAILHGGPEGTEEGPPPPEPAPVEVVTGSTALPPALVTPRMLLGADWLEWCRPLQLPT